jgi:hypothetical protein
MSMIFKTALICCFAALVLNIPTASFTFAGMGSTVSQSYHPPPRTGSAVGTTPGWRHPPLNCGTRHWPCPTGSVGGTNKWTCKQNGEGCNRQY